MSLSACLVHKKGDLKNSGFEKWLCLMRLVRKSNQNFLPCKRESCKKWSTDFVIFYRL